MALARASQRRDLIFRHPGPVIEPWNSFLPLQPMYRPFVSQAVEGHNVDSVQFAWCLPLAGGVEPATGGDTAALGADSVSIYMRPSDGHLHRAPILPDCPCFPSVTRSVLFPRPAALDALLRSHWRTPSGSGFPATNSPRIRRAAYGPSTGRVSCRSLRRKHVFGLGSGAHFASLRARVSRGQSGQIQRGEITWHSTYQLCGIGAVLVSAILRAAPGPQALDAADVTMSWLPTGGPGGAPGRQITPWRRSE